MHGGKQLIFDTDTIALLVNDVYDCLPNSDCIDTMLNIETDNDNDDHVVVLQFCLLTLWQTGIHKTLAAESTVQIFRNAGNQLDIFAFMSQNCDLTSLNAFKSSKVCFN